MNLIPLDPTSRPAVQRFIRDHWGADFVVAHGQAYYPHELPGFAAFDEAGAIVGLITYRLDGGDCQVVTVDSLRPGQGLGSALLNAVVEAALAETRRLKPSLPLVGEHGIPLRDELALELPLDPA